MKYKIVAFSISVYNDIKCFYSATTNLLVSMEVNQNSAGTREQRHLAPLNRWDETPVDCHLVHALQREGSHVDRQDLLSL